MFSVLNFMKAFEGGLTRKKAKPPEKTPADKKAESGEQEAAKPEPETKR